MAKKKSLPKGIRMSDNGKFIVDVTVDGRRQTATCSTVDEALKRQLEFRGILSTSSSVETMNEGSSSWTLGKACDYIMQTRWKDARNQSSSKSKISAVLSFFSSDTHLDELTPLALTEFSTYLKKKYTSGTAKLYFSGLATIMRTAVECMGLEKMPPMPKVKSKSRRIRYFTEVEEKAILDYFQERKNQDMYDIVACLVDTGMRCNELLHLTPKDIDIDAKLISIWENKTDKPRSVPMTARVYSIISRRLMGNTGRRRIYDIAYSNLAYHWRIMRDTLFAGQNDCVPHTLRHTCCSRMIQGGAPVTHVMAWMGHRTIGTTMVYAHLAPDSLNGLLVFLE